MLFVQRELINLFAAVDEAFSEVQKSFPAQVKCGEGCDDCCRAVFDISLVEAVALASMFLGLPEEQAAAVRDRSAKALAEWESIAREMKPEEISMLRIDCPLLGEDSLCMCYEARPVNCRAYGIPTVINGAGHVCGFSGFEPGIDYPTFNLVRVQNALLDLSSRLAGDENGRLRWPVAKVLFNPKEVFALL